MSVGHTKGPWRVGADLVRVHPYWRDEGGSCTPENFHRNGFAKTIAAVGREDGDWRGIEQQVADARLIAAAPELLEALEGLHLFHVSGGHEGDADEALRAAEAAIARATGA